MEQKLSYQIWTWQHNRKNKDLRADTNYFHSQNSHKKNQANSYNAKNFLQISVGPVLSASIRALISVSLLDAEWLVLLVYTVSSGSCTLPTSSALRFPELRLGEFDGDLIFRLILHVMSGCWSLHLFPSTERGSFPDDD